MGIVVTPRIWLTFYLGAVVTITFIHAPAMLAALLAIAVAASGTRRWKLLRRALLAILAFNLTISAGYAAVALWQGNFAPGYLLLVNLRVLLLVYIGFWFVASVDLLGALAGWPLATLLFTLSIGQIKTFERILRDFRLAFKSRNLVRPKLADRGRNAAAQAQTLLDKSLASANEAALAMRSRGAFDD
jgi:cobalt/nickel transport system permease protein